ncbi:ArsR family transcriptional regulator [Nocardia arthritidis]|uniref:ArsR family transcriptional regulator n=1 Tax=Nocardia arthritidis TaxID=228602 RepID=A0A6G9YHI5_9NOCA|nr:ArsR family transcriptional regulator [Nocardia arthritidis]
MVARPGLALPAAARRGPGRGRGLFAVHRRETGVSQPTCGEHLKILAQAGLVRGKKIKQWVFYQRDEDRIAEAKRLLSHDW